MKTLEDYVINELEALKKENTELKETVNKMQSKNEIHPALGVAYHIFIYDWYINKNNVQYYQRAVDDKDFEWLLKHEMHLEEVPWHYELILGSTTFRLSVTTENEKIKMDVLNIDNSSLFLDYSEATERLLIEVQERINKVKNSNN